MDGMDQHFVGVINRRAKNSNCTTTCGRSSNFSAEIPKYQKPKYQKHKYKIQSYNWVSIIQPEKLFQSSFKLIQPKTQNIFGGSLSFPECNLEFYGCFERGEALNGFSSRRELPVVDRRAIESPGQGGWLSGPHNPHISSRWTK